MHAHPIQSHRICVSDIWPDNSLASFILPTASPTKCYKYPYTFESWRHRAPYYLFLLSCSGRWMAQSNGTYIHNTTHGHTITDLRIYDCQPYYFAPFKCLFLSVFFYFHNREECQMVGACVNGGRLLKYQKTIKAKVKKKKIEGKTTEQIFQVLEMDQNGHEQ